MVTSGGQSVTAHASNLLAGTVEDLKHTLGEGPGVAASDSGAAVLVPDLVDLTDVNAGQWPTFAKESAAIGVRAAFAFPLLLGTASSGAFSLYRTAAGGLSLDELSQGWISADAVALTLAGPEEHLVEAGHLDPMRVHQAAGVVVQVGQHRGRAGRHDRASTPAPVEGGDLHIAAELRPQPPPQAPRPRPPRGLPATPRRCRACGGRPREHC